MANARYPIYQRPTTKPKASSRGPFFKPEARLTMPYDPNSPRNPLPPLNDGYPDDWHVPPSAQDDSFPDDWYVPPSAQPNAANIGFTAPPGSIAAYWSRLADQSDPSNVGAPPESSRRSS